MFKKMLFLFFLFSANMLQGQISDLRLIGGLDIRNSFIRQNPVKIYGAYLGVTIREKERFTIGAYALTPESSRDLVAIRSNNTVTITNARLFYTGIGYSYRFVRWKFISLHLPLEAGIGYTQSSRLERRGGQDILLSDDHGFFPVQAGLKLELRLSPWIGLAGTSGYRLALLNEEYQADYNGLYYTFGLSFYLSKIYKDLLYLNETYGE
jgi:hypothetical protein